MVLPLSRLHDVRGALMAESHLCLKWRKRNTIPISGCQLMW